MLRDLLLGLVACALVLGVGSCLVSLRRVREDWRYREDDDEYP